MTVHLPEDLERYVQAKVQSGRFASEEDAVTQALRQLQREDEASAPNGDLQSSTVTPVWERIVQIMSKVPDSVIDQMPTDGAAQLDHYIYGTPKRPNP